MVQRNTFVTAAPWVPDGRPSLSILREASTGCHGCDLWEPATQTVFGAGRAHAKVMLVGEQPGDVEDRQGEPFVGPAGKLLDRALDEAGLDRSTLYLTNIVKHFRWKSTAGSSRRIHEKPGAAHVQACIPWLSAELKAVNPDVVVALGATAAQGLFGRNFRLTEQRGVTLEWPSPEGTFATSGVKTLSAVATIHPSAVLRTQGTGRKEAFDGLVRDLCVVREMIGQPA
jgi:uracil-DNA glycosylase family protein